MYVHNGLLLWKRLCCNTQHITEHQHSPMTSHWMKRKTSCWVLTQDVSVKVWWNHLKNHKCNNMTIPDVRDQSSGKWQYRSSETITVHTGPAVYLILSIRQPLSFDFVCHGSLHLTHLNHVHGIEMLWKTDSIIIQSIMAHKKDVIRLPLSPMLFEVQMVCTLL